MADFVFALVNNNGYNSLYQAKTSWVNNIPASYVTTVSTGDAYRGENALFQFTLASLSGKQTHVVLKFNDLFAALTTAPAGSVLLTSRTVRFDITNQTTSTFSLTLQTPVIFSDYTFSTETYISDANISYLIGQSTSNIWRHTCYNTVCKRCNPTNTSICIDCYNTTISDYYIYDTLLQSCRRDCLTGYFMSGTTCSPCATSCVECANVSINCTSCSSTQSLFLDTVYMKCVTTCPDTYYKNTQIQSCLACSSPCLHCT